MIYTSKVLVTHDLNSVRSEAETIEYLNRFREPFLDDLGCTITKVNTQDGLCEMEFVITVRHCHSGDIIQGGFVAAMLDAVSTHTLFATDQDIVGVSSLEFKTVFLEASRAGTLTAVGRIDKLARSIAFMSAELHNAHGVLTATMSTTAKLRRATK